MTKENRWWLLGLIIGELENERRVWQELPGKKAEKYVEAHKLAISVLEEALEKEEEK